MSFQAGASEQALIYQQIRRLRIPLPLLSIQQTIIGEIEAEQVFASGNREVIARFEKKIHAVLARVWGDDELTT